MTVPIQFVFSDGRSFSIPVGQGASVLAASKLAGLSLLVDCEEGSCGTCMARVLCGSMDMEAFNEGLLSPSEIRDGAVLVCRSKATGPAIVEIPYSSDDAQMQGDDASISAVVCGVKVAAEETLALTVRTEVPFTFLAGQYVNISPHPGLERSFSMANEPGTETLNFYVALRADGLFSRWLQSAQPGTPLQLSSPRGTFFLREDQRPKVMIAGGTGLAPMLAMLKKLAAAGEQERSIPITLLWGARSEEHLFELDTLKGLQQRLPGLEIQVACDDIREGSSTRRGRVTAVLDEIALDRAAIVYACGPPPMIEGVRQILKRRSFPMSQLLCEKFTG